ncbi:MAG: alpha-D-ribose 1-methylphosphonate 5-triphosphate diphosphatase [Azospirillaceae bacterium]|nr:alpha-D-ribose 1-methylphosphonate 5-triphosphate diphosphatase [Azospirillaceae bacterium]
MIQTVFTNAMIVTADAVWSGTVTVQDDLIIDVEPGRSRVAGAIDCDGDYLLPGLIELHTDNLELHVIPRPGVVWSIPAAVLAHDAQMATAGITTVFDAVALGDVIDTSDRRATLGPVVAGLEAMVASGHLRADHRLHLRCEVSQPDAREIFETFADHSLVGIVSVMDHTPGQRQFGQIEKYYEYYQGKYGFTDRQMAEFVLQQTETANRHSAGNREAIAAGSRQRGLVLASHDDATAEHVFEAIALGARFSEFPTTIAAAQAAHAAGIPVLMGAPNLVRGGSHSGNVAAADLVALGCLDLLSSDYVPLSLLQSAFLLHQGPSALPLPAAVATVSRQPAAVAGLSDRGTIAPGWQADLVRVHDAGTVKVVRGVWRRGLRVA